MKLNRLGSSALEVSEICLGTMTWGEQNSAGEAHAQIERALERGINFIDNAEMYPIPPAEKTQGATSIRQLDELAAFFDLELSKEAPADVEAVNAVYPSPCAQ